MRLLISAALVLILAAAFITKPSEADFRQAVRTTGEAIPLNSIESAVVKGAIALGAYEYRCDDYVLFRLCELGLPDGETRYIGAFRRFISI